MHLFALLVLFTSAERYQKQLDTIDLDVAEPRFLWKQSKPCANVRRELPGDAFLKLYLETPWRALPQLKVKFGHIPELSAVFRLQISKDSGNPRFIIRLGLGPVDANIQLNARDFSVRPPSVDFKTFTVSIARGRKSTDPLLQIACELTLDQESSVRVTVSDLKHNMYIHNMRAKRAKSIFSRSGVVSGGASVGIWVGNKLGVPKWIRTLVLNLVTALAVEALKDLLPITMYNLLSSMSLEATLDIDANINSVGQFSYEVSKVTQAATEMVIGRKAMEALYKAASSELETMGLPGFSEMGAVMREVTQSELGPFHVAMLSGEEFALQMSLNVKPSNPNGPTITPHCVMDLGRIKQMSFSAAFDLFSDLTLGVVEIFHQKMPTLTWEEAQKRWTNECEYAYLAMDHLDRSEAPLSRRLVAWLVELVGHRDKLTTIKDVANTLSATVNFSVHGNVNAENKSRVLMLMEGMSARTSFDIRKLWDAIPPGVVP